MITRTFGKLFRGTATPFQMISACVLAAALGFMPGLIQAPGLIVVLVLLLIILNANLALAALVGVLAKLLSLLLMPASFAVGRALLDGPLRKFFATLINAPVFALFGFDYYATTGGLVVGLLVGLLIGVLVVKAVSAYRRKMAELEEGSERFKQYSSKWWVKLLTFIFIGGNKGKKTYQELLAIKVGNPIRPLGVVFAVLTCVLLVVLRMFAAEPIVTAALQRGLERANGATVDIGGAELDLKGNRLTINSLAVADANNLDTDLFRAAKLEADVSGVNLLRKRLQLDRVQITDGSHGEARKSRGHIVGKPPEPSPETKPAGDVKTIDDYIKDAKLWKERLAQVRRWLEKISGPKDEKTTPGEDEETLPERLAREIREMGYARVRASHLVEGSPTFTITELIAQKVRVAGLPDETLDITGRNLSTHPGLLGKPPQIDIKSSRDTLGFATYIGDVVPGQATNTLHFHYRGLPVDKVAGSLKIGDTTPLQGGTIDLAASGDWRKAGGVTVNLPLEVVLHNTTISLGGKPTKVETLALPIGLQGPLDNPRIKIDQKALTTALAKAGVAQATAELKGKAQQKLDEQLGDKVPTEAKGLLKGILGGPKEKK